ncbi:MAG: TonB-dependent receptor [Flavobacterium sp.]|jgi:TonB-linked SusC/RagA family outer membrane protein|nr:TonB-dependent receptor [Flavobacterium sp.]
MKSKLLFIAFVLFTSMGYSQFVEISGKVIDSKTNTPLVGVNVEIQNSSQFLITDVDGSFKFSKVPSGSKIIFSFVGYKNYEFKANKSQKLTIELQAASENLDEIVVVGYGSKKKRNITGSVSVVSSKTIDDLKPINATQALQGTVAGVVVTSGSGAPGSGFNIRIRGISSNSSNAPYTLIDGYEGDISLLNPSDIESVTVLKDAQASVYGSKGANGVVLVTTKMGKKNSKVKVAFNSYFGYQETTKKINVLNATEYALLLNESYGNGGQALPYPISTGLGKGTDWQDQVFQKAGISNRDFSLSGGSDKITFSLSASNIAQDGIIGLDKSGFDRSNARVSLGIDISPKLNFSTNLIYTDYNRKSLNENGIGSVLFNAINTPATLLPYNTDGTYSLVPATPGFGNEVINPLAQIENTYNNYNQQRINGNFVLQYKPTNDFKITTRYGFDSANDVGKSFSKRLDYGNSKVFNVTNNSVSQKATRFSSFTFDLFGEYEKTFFEDHKIKLTVGGTLFENKGEGLFATGFNVPYNSWQFADIALAGAPTFVDLDVDPNSLPRPGIVTNGSYKSTPYRRPSIFSTLDYNFKEKYLLSFIFRRDQSSSFSENNSVAYFKSILGGWIVSQEDFFNKNGIVNFLKLKGSYGTLGNDVAPSNAYRSQLSGEGVYVFDNVLTTGVAVGTIPNKDLRWESDTKIDLGFESRLFDNRLEVTADYFNNTRTDLIIGGVPISGINGGYAPGSGAPAVNAGKVKNSGFELVLNYKDNISDLKYDLGFNITTINNEVLEVNNSTNYIEGGAFAIGQLPPTRMEVGQPIGVFYGLQTDGIFQNQAEINAAPTQNLGSPTSPGDLRFKDVNGDGVVDFKDRTYIGKSIADYTLGFNINLSYKNFDFVSYSYASVGNDMIRNYERTENKLNKLNYVLDRWTGEGTSNSVPRVTTGASSNNLFSSYFVEDASFLRIQTIQLGYSLPKMIIDSFGISKFRLYGAINNVYTFSKYRGFDATANTGDPIAGGIDSGFYPAPRIFSIGLNVNF